MKRFPSQLLGIGLLLLACGCAAVTDERLTATDSLIRTAEEMGTRAVPQAIPYLQLAKDENGRAQKLLNRGDPVAKGQLMRAQADAELALALVLAHQ